MRISINITGSRTIKRYKVVQHYGSTHTAIDFDNRFAVIRSNNEIVGSRHPTIPLCSLAI